MFSQRVQICGNYLPREMLKVSFPENGKNISNFQQYSEIESLISPKLNEKRYLSHVFLDISLQKMSYLVVRIISD